MADLLGGDTIHHAINIGIFGMRKKEKGSQEMRAGETMRSVLMLRWLIIDEISMVSARLLADIDYQLRNYYRHNSDFAKNKKTDTLRPFAGVSVLFSGDFWQLPPPEGGFLGDLPFEYIQ